MRTTSRTWVLFLTGSYTRAASRMTPPGCAIPWCHCRPRSARPSGRAAGARALRPARRSRACAAHPARRIDVAQGAEVGFGQRFLALASGSGVVSSTAEGAGVAMWRNTDASGSSARRREANYLVVKRVLRLWGLRHLSQKRPVETAISRTRLSTARSFTSLVVLRRPALRPGFGDPQATRSSCSHPWPSKMVRR
jgi:hypothetical protein